jgi:hypothetical protein
MLGDVTVLDVSKRSLQRVRYDDAARFVELYRDANDEETVWVRIGEKPPPPPPAPSAADGGVPAGGADAGVGPGGSTDGGTPGAVAAAPPPPPPPPPPPRELRGNETARTLWSRLAPLKASRALGKLDAKKLEELGLANSPRKLTLTVEGKEQTLTLASTGNAWGPPYLLREDGHVFLLGPTILPELEGAANRLVDRRPHTFELGDFDSFTVTQGKNSRTYVVSGKAQQGPISVAPQSAPDKPDEFVRNWHERVWRLVPLDFLGRGAEPPGGAPEELFRVEYKRGDKVQGHVIVARGARGDLYMRTEHTESWAKLQAGVDTLASEAIKVASGS